MHHFFIGGPEKTLKHECNDRCPRQRRENRLLSLVQNEKFPTFLSDKMSITLLFLDVLDTYLYISICKDMEKEEKFQI